MANLYEITNSNKQSFIKISSYDSYSHTNIYWIIVQHLKFWSSSKAITKRHTLSKKKKKDEKQTKKYYTKKIVYRYFRCTHHKHTLQFIFLFDFDNFSKIFVLCASKNFIWINKCSSISFVYGDGDIVSKTRHLPRTTSTNVLPLVLLFFLIFVFYIWFYCLPMWRIFVRLCVLYHHQNLIGYIILFCLFVILLLLYDMVIVILLLVVVYNATVTLLDFCHPWYGLVIVSHTYQW